MKNDNASGSVIASLEMRCGKGKVDDGGRSTCSRHSIQMFRSSSARRRRTARIIESKTQNN